VRDETQGETRTYPFLAFFLCKVPVTSRSGVSQGAHRTMRMVKWLRSL
jgi:hypothetical protein